MNQHKDGTVEIVTECGIEWTEITWNPLRGCLAISPGCVHCYAAAIAAKMAARGKAYEGLAKPTFYGPRWTGEVLEASWKLSDPEKWDDPKMVFVNSMSDLFFERVRELYIQQIFTVMRDTPRHTYQILTKRSERMLDLDPRIDWPENVWMGVSVENNDYLGRIDDLRRTSAYVKFLSLEPLLGPLPDLDLTGIDWVIAGGESGPDARAMDVTWVREIRELCLSSGVPFFFKQWGGVDRRATGRTLDGRTWDEMPLITR